MSNQQPTQMVVSSPEILPTTSNSAAAVESASAPEFNYKYPQVQADGSVIIEANFADRKQENKALMTAKNCEVPLELKRRGRLPEAVDQKIQYRRCRPGEPFFVRQNNHTNYNGEFVGEEQIHAMPDVEQSINRVRKMLCKRSEAFPDQSDFEMILAGTKGELKPAARRAYGLGFTIDQNSQFVSGYTLNARTVENRELLAEFHREVAFIATTILESSHCPKDTLELVRRRYDHNAACTYGSEDNKYFTASQLNFSPVQGESVDLEVAIGEVGALHADYADDPTLWTVLINFSNLPKGMDPGRMILTGLRVYADMGPNTALIFKGVHTHLPIPPGPMDSSDLAPYVTKYVPDLDPAKYLYGRVFNVNYPKKIIMDQSALKLRTLTPGYLNRDNSLVCNAPDFLPKSSAVWGSKRNAMESKARISAFNLTRLSRHDPQLLPPTAEAISSLHRWQEGDIIHAPRIERIQAVIDANLESEENKEHSKKWAEYASSCELQVSQVMFEKPGKNGSRLKAGPTNWVSEVGSSLIGLSVDEEVPRATVPKAKVPKARKPQQDEEEEDNSLEPYLVNRPFKCPLCDLRYTRISACYSHHKREHEDFEFVKPEATPDPNPRQRRGKAKQEVPRAEEYVAGIGGNQTQRRKRNPSLISDGGVDEEDTDFVPHQKMGRASSPIARRATMQSSKGDLMDLAW